MMSLQRNLLRRLPRLHLHTPSRLHLRRPSRLRLRSLLRLRLRLLPCRFQRPTPRIKRRRHLSFQLTRPQAAHMRVQTPRTHCFLAWKSGLAGGCSIHFAASLTCICLRAPLRIVWKPTTSRFFRARCARYFVDKRARKFAGSSTSILVSIMMTLICDSKASKAEITSGQSTSRWNSISRTFCRGLSSVTTRSPACSSATGP
mmetsp:Transcript_11571/g.31189  ORF Transcript_11571/g.31189 Transcript_11571/m.31189 type:complete len:202 (+) Transcript_11571:517-1122(+)